MWSKPARAASTAAALVLAAVLVACGGDKSKRDAGPLGARVDKRLAPIDVIPGDLDLVVRIDLARMRAGIGPAVADALGARALAGAKGDVLQSSLPCADAIWLGARAGELDAGDHVIVLEGKDCAPEANLKDWTRIGAANAQLTIFKRQGDAPRAGTAEVIALSPRTTAFVSPVELDSVHRILRDGPDPLRGDPRAEGLISLDLRLVRLPPSLEKRFPSIGGIVAGLSRLRATAVLVDEGLQIDAELIGRGPKETERALKFLRALTDTLAASRYGAALRDLTIEPIESTLRLHLVVPKKLVLTLLAEDDGQR